MDASESPVLILTNDMDEHADLIIEELERLDIAVVRLHAEEILTDCEVIIAESESRLHIRSSGRAVAAETIRSVWYRRPKKPKSSQQNAGAREFEEREATDVLRAFYDRIQGAWYSHPDSIAKARNKISQLRLAKHLGWSVPEFILTSNASSLFSFIGQYPSAVIKAISPFNCSVDIEEGMVGLFARIIDRAGLEEMVECGLPCPVFLQQRIERRTDLRITIIGRTVFAVSITLDTCSSTEVDSRLGWASASYEIIKLDSGFEERLLRFLAFYGLNYGAFDFILDPSGTPWFLECNPVGQFAWIDAKVDTGMCQAMASQLAGMIPPLVGHNDELEWLRGRP
jgi:hypothetical protein